MNVHHAIAMRSVQSSQIAEIGHDPETNTLAIRFNAKGAEQGPLYHYDNFTATDFAAFAGAESVGSHFYRYIKPHSDKYPYRKIEPVSAPAIATPPGYDTAKDAVAYVLKRLQEEPRLAYLMGPGSECYDRIVRAHCEMQGLDVTEFRAQYENRLQTEVAVHTPE